MKVKITKRTVEAAVPGAKDQYIFDRELIGFGFKVTPAGRRTYFAQGWVDGRKVRVTIGQHGPVTADQARVEAHKLLAQIAAGQDPSVEKAEAKKALTMADLAEKFLSEHASLKKKPRSLAEDQRMLRSFVVPRMGSRKVAAISRTDVAKLHHGLRETPYQANRCLALVSKMMNLAEKWGLRPDGSNPCRHVEKFKEAKRERFLSGDELARLGQALSDAEVTGAVDPRHIACFRLLLFSGMRLNEVLTLKWSAVDLEGGCLRLEDAKAGPRTVYLNDPALEVLARLPRLAGSDYVLPGDKAGGHLVNVQKAWRKIITAAHLDNLRVHDLRHSFASVAAAAGMNLPLVGRLLGHKELATSLRYSHLAADPVRAASQEVGRLITDALARQSGQKVVPMRPKG
jgi:integrase